MQREMSSWKDELRSVDCFKRVEAELLALPKEQLLAVNTDTTQAVTIVLGVLPKLKALREQLVEALRSFDFAQFDKLEDYALALSYTNARYVMALSPPDGLAELMMSGARLRQLLVAEARLLVLHGVIDAKKVKGLKGASGYSNLSADLLTLSMMLEDVWPEMEGKTRTTLEDLKMADRISVRITALAYRHREQPRLVPEAVELRRRAFTLLCRAYDDARSAVSFLQRERGTVKDRLPALHQGRRRRRTVQAQVEATSVTQMSSAPSVAMISAPKPSEAAVGGPFLTDAAPVALLGPGRQ